LDWKKELAIASYIIPIAIFVPAALRIDAMQVQVQAQIFNYIKIWLWILAKYKQ
jgi:hypothetical protein